MKTMRKAYIGGGGLIFRELAYIWNELMLIHGGGVIWGDYIGGGLIFGGGALYAEVYGIPKQEKTIDLVAMANIT